MAEEQYFNPWDADNLIRGGGLWDGKVVTIVSAKTMTERFTHSDGTPVASFRDPNEQATQNILQIIGIAEDGDRERAEAYSAGALIPTPDGEGFTKADGSFAGFHERSALGKFVDQLKIIGFPTGKLYDDKTHRSKLSNLVGAQFLMKGEPRLDKNGNIKKNKKGYEEQAFFPVKFVGFKEGVGGATSIAGDTINDEASDAMLELLKEAGGTLTRAELVRKINIKFTSNRATASKVLGLVTREDFHRGKPWTRTDTGYTLG